MKAFIGLFSVFNRFIIILINIIFPFYPFMFSFSNIFLDYIQLSLDELIRGGFSETHQFFERLHFLNYVFPFSINVFQLSQLNKMRNQKLVELSESIYKLSISGRVFEGFKKEWTFVHCLQIKLDILVFLFYDIIQKCRYTI